MPTSFKLNSTDANAFQYDAKAQVGGYAELVYDSYKASHEGAVKLQKAITAFLAKPTTENMAAARNAWVNARIPKHRRGVRDQTLQPVGQRLSTLLEDLRHDLFEESRIRHADL